LSSGLHIVFFGTPAVAVPTLERLLASRHEIVMVVSQPDRPRRRGKKSAPSPVAEVAIEAGVPLLRPERIGAEEAIEALAEAAPDIGVVVAFGQFIPKRVREIPGLGYLINAHASLLPRYRGASPITQAILDGEKRTGVSVMRVEKQMDGGPVALVREIEIGKEENTDELTGRLAELAGDAILAVLDEIEAGEVEWIEQNEAEVSMAPKLEKSDGLLDWSLPAVVLVRRIHGLAPKPGAFTHLPADESGQPALEALRILRARAARAESTPILDPPGTLRLGAGSGEPIMRIATGEGWLIPKIIQRAGGKPMAPEAFLRGHPLPDGCRLGDSGKLAAHG
jgi:methionyl-tRNA formyltransferase